MCFIFDFHGVLYKSAAKSFYIVESVELIIYNGVHGKLYCEPYIKVLSVSIGNTAEGVT